MVNFPSKRVVNFVQKGWSISDPIEHLTPAINEECSLRRLKASESWSRAEAWAKFSETWDQNLWGGMQQEANKKSTAWVTGIVAEVSTDSSEIKWTKAKSGSVGHPHGEWVEGYRDALDEWRDRFGKWAAAISGQACSPNTPEVPPTVRRLSPGIAIWVEDPDPQGVPQYQGYAPIQLTMPTENIVSGFAIDRRLLCRILNSSDSDSVPTKLSLLHNSRIALQRNEYRLAIAEAGTAAELCLLGAIRKRPRRSVF